MLLESISDTAHGESYEQTGTLVSGRRGYGKLENLEFLRSDPVNRCATDQSEAGDE